MGGEFNAVVLRPPSPLGAEKNEVEGLSMIGGGRGPKSLSVDLSGQMAGVGLFVFRSCWCCVYVLGVFLGFSRDWFALE